MTGNLPPTTLPTAPAAPESAGRIPKTVAYYGVFAAFGMVGAALGPTLTRLAENTRTELGQISILFTAFGLGRLIGAWQSGQFYDRREGHRVMALMLIIMAAMLVLVPLMPLLWLLAAVFVIVGLSEGALDVGGNTLIVWVHREKVGPFMNGLHFAFGFGALLSPLIIARAVSNTGAITWAYWVLALLMTPVIVLLLRVPSPVALRATEDSSTRRANRLLVALIVLFFFLYVGAEVSFAGWIFTYAVRLNLATETMAFYLTSGFFAALTLGRLLAIPIAARFRPRWILSNNFAGCLVSLGLLLLWSDSVIVIWLGTLGLGLSMASVFPTTLTLAERRMTITGQVTSWFLLGASAGAMFLPWLIGQFFERIGPRTTMVTIVIDLLAAIVVLGVLLLKSTPKT